MPAQVIGSGKGIVKFFNGQKGFGFIQVDDRPDDVFVHISAVEQAGLTGLAEGQPLEFTLVDRGGKVSATDLVIDGEPIAVPERAPRPERQAFDRDRPPREGGGGFRGGDRDSAPRGPQRESTGERANGTVKFFNDMKGFGFVQRDDGGEDVFVHISALERSGMGQVTQGDRLAFDIEIDRRGKYSATNLSTLSRNKRPANFERRAGEARWLCPPFFISSLCRCVAAKKPGALFGLICPVVEQAVGCVVTGLWSARFFCVL